MFQLRLARANTVHVTHYTLHPRLGTTGRGMYPAEHQSRRVEANVGEKEALRYKVWACPIPGVEKGVAFGVRESKRYSIAQ